MRSQCTPGATWVAVPGAGVSGKGYWGPAIEKELGTAGLESTDPTMQLSEKERDRAKERAEFSIGELATEFDVTPRAIRFYEDHGLLAPRRDGQRRIYS